MIFGKAAVSAQEYQILKKAFEEKLSKEAILRLFDMREKVQKADVSPSASY